MKKILLFLIGFLFTLSLSAQSWIVPANGWAQQRVKVIYRDSIYLAKPIYFGGAVSGYIIIKPDNAAQGTIVIPSSASTDTLSTKAYARSVGGEGGAGMIYPGSGIAVSTGSTWGASVTNNSTNWNTAYTDRLKWDGGATDLVAATGRTSLGATTVGSAFFTLANPSAITFPRIDAANTVTARSATELKTDLSLGNVTNESKATMFTNPTFTGTVTIPTPFTLGAVSVTSTGTQLNYLSGATGTTGTGSVVLSASPTFTGHPTIEGVTSTGATGSGDFVFATSPTLITPALGTPSAIVLTNATGTAASLTSGAVTNGVYTTDTTTMLTPYIERKDTTGMLSTYILDSEARTAINDTTTARLAAATTGIAIVDTINGGGDDLIPGIGYLKSYVGSGGGLSGSILRFIVGTTTGAPTTADSILMHSDFVSKHIDVYRDGALTYFNTTATNTVEGFRHRTNSDTLYVNPLWQDNEQVEIRILEPITWSDIALEGQGSDLLTDLVYYYKLDESVVGGATDVMGVQNAVAYIDSVKTGIINYGRKTNYKGYMHQNYNTNATPKGTDYSISMWVKLDTLASTIGKYQALYFVKNNSATPSYNIHRLLLGSSDNKLTYYSYNYVGAAPGDTLQSTVTSSSALTTGTWYHIVSVNADTLQLYVNGVNVSATAVLPVGDVYEGKGATEFGNQGYGYTNNIRGVMDEIAHYSKKLTKAEVISLYNSGNGKQHPF